MLLRRFGFVIPHTPLRKDKLTWSHHALLAALERDEQRRWLDRAIADRLSVEDLRIELRATRRRCVAQADAERTRGGQGRSVRCPNCGDRVPIPDGRLA